MGEIMQFPETVEDFMQQYKITDTQQVYTNGTELVPIFRMKQWFEAHKQRWIPCSERMPKDGQDVLIWDNIDKTSFTGHYVWCDGWTVDGYDVNRFHFDITHWMPLPEPPEEEP